MARTQIQTAKEITVRPAASGPDVLPVQIRLPALAELLGIGLTACRELAEKKVLVKGSGPGRFILKASVQAYAARLRKLSDGRGGEKGINGVAHARARLMDQQAGLAGLKARSMARELIEANEVADFWAERLRMFRTRIMGVHAKFDSIPTRIRVELQAELRSALDELADTEA